MNVQKNTVSVLPTVMLSQPCFCLCFGFSQMTMTLPLRRMILHFSQIGFTDGRTFMCCYLLLKMMPRGRAECTARPDASDAMCLSHSASVIIHQRPPSVKRKILRDPISTSRIEDLAIELKKDYTIIMVTHNMQQATRISDRTAFFLLGEMVEYGATDKLFSVPQDKRTEDYITGRFA